MPVDQWKKANERAKYGAAKPKAERKTPKRTARRLTMKQIKSRFNRHSPIGFGRYAHVEIQNVPRDYLWWLVTTIDGKRNARMEAIVEYVKEYLAH